MSKVKYNSRRYISNIKIREEMKIFEQQMLRKEYEKQVEEYKKSTSYIKRQVRQKLLQNLDKANKNEPKNKVKNMLQFFDEFINLLKDEYNQLTNEQQQLKTNQIQLARNFNVHISVVKEFDNNTALAPELGYTERLFDKLNKVLEELNPNLVQFFNYNSSMLYNL